MWLYSLYIYIRKRVVDYVGDRVGDRVVDRVVYRTVDRVVDRDSSKTVERRSDSVRHILILNMDKNTDICGSDVKGDENGSKKRNSIQTLLSSDVDEKAASKELTFP
jgi:hypothetical protein